MRKVSVFHIVCVGCGLFCFFVHLNLSCDCSLTKVSVGTVLLGFVIFNVVRILDRMFFCFQDVWCISVISSLLHISFVLIVVNHFSVWRALYGSVFF